MPASTDIDNKSVSALTLFGKMLTFTRIKLETADLDQIENHLSSILTNKSSQIPVIVDSDIEQDLPALIDLFWKWGLQPIGVVTGILDNAAKDLKLAIFPADGKRIERIIPKAVAKANPAVQSPVAPITQQSSDDTSPSDPPNLNTAEQGTDSSTNQNLTEQHETTTVEQTPEAVTEIALHGNDSITSMIYDQMLRSGQSINHVGGDLILTSSVNHGAEVITDNSLHIYGRAQGRLVAGATGDKEARIFCQRFNPSLVSVAGTYCTNDDIPKDVIDKAVQVSFKEGVGLVFDIMGTV